MLDSVTSEDCKALECGVEEDSPKGHLQRLSVVGQGWGMLMPEQTREPTCCLLSCGSGAGPSPGTLSQIHL